MTRVIFYSKLADKQLALASILQEALQKQRKVTIFAENEAAALALSEAIWHSDSNSFMPNVLASDVLAKDTPVVIDWHEKTLFQDDILINLTQRQIIAFSRFKELVELVGHAEDDKVAARVRYKFYRDRGYEIRHHEGKQ